MKIPDWTYEIPWDSRRGELILEVRHTLTEPTCPTATIKWETSGECVCSVHGNTVEEAIESALNKFITAFSHLFESDDEENPTCNDCETPSEEMDANAR